MITFNENSTRRVLTPWGIEVKTRLLSKGMKQQDLVLLLQKNGFQINKITLSQLLYGVGISKRIDIISKINEILNIPFN